MMTWVVYGLMAGALLAAFRAVTLVLLARQAFREGRTSSGSYLRDRGAALEWAMASAGCAVALALGGLWRVAQAVTR